MTPRRELQAVADHAARRSRSATCPLAGRAPAHVWWEMAARTFGREYEVGQVLHKATALTLTGLGVALALDASLFNIGAEGQLTAGVLACALVGAALPRATPAVIAIPACALAAAAAGASIGALIAVLRVRRGAHEVITSIMLNAIVAGVSLWIGNTYVFTHGNTRGPAIVAGAELPPLGLHGSSANAAIAIAAAAVIALTWLRARGDMGNEMWRAVGRRSRRRA